MMVPHPPNKLVVLAAGEVGGRWSETTVRFIEALATHLFVRPPRGEDGSQIYPARVNTSLVGHVGRIWRKTPRGRHSRGRCPPHLLPGWEGAGAAVAGLSLLHAEAPTPSRLPLS